MNKEDKIYDSGKFDWCIDIDYPIAITNRCVFFYSTASKYRKVLNDAEYFSQDNNICVVFLYGSLNEDSIERELSKKLDSHIIVVHYGSKLFDDCVNIISEWQEVLEREKMVGGLNDTKTDMSDQRIKEIQEHLSVQSDSEDIKSFQLMEFKRLDKRKEYKHTLELLELAQKNDVYTWLDTITVSGQVYRTKGVFDNFIKNLTGSVLSLFAYGIEAETDEPYAYKSIAIKRIVTSIESGNTASGKLDIDLSDRGSSPYEFIQAGTQFIENKLNSDGFFEWQELIQYLSKPPYGFQYDNNYYAYLLAMIIYPYRHFYCLRLNGCVEYTSLNLLYLVKEYRADLGKNEEQKFRNKIMIYKPNKRYFAVIKMINDLSETKDSCKTITEAASKLFYRLQQEKKSGVRIFPFCMVNSEYDLIVNNQFDWYERGSLCKHNSLTEYGWFRPEQVNDVYFSLKENEQNNQRYMNEGDSFVKEKLLNQYSEEQVDSLVKYWSENMPMASVWCYNRKWCKGEIENFMNACDSGKVCRECGKFIVNKDRGDYIVKTNDSVTIQRLTFKEIVGLNQKLIDRNMTKFYCLSCLAELIECTESDLYEKVQEFKEEGCELFG